MVITFKITLKSKIKYKYQVLYLGPMIYPFNVGDDTFYDPNAVLGL